MVAFARIRKAALARHGATELAARMPAVKSAAALKRLTDDRYFSQMSLRIFRAGLKHSVVDAKWPAFEEAFRGFDPRRVRAMRDEEVEDLMKDARLIRHLGKLRAVHDNAAAFIALAADKGGMGKYLADWPGEEITQLWDDLAKRFAQMGGNSTPRFLRMIGKDTFLLTPSVVAALDHWGAFKGEPKSKADRAKVQAVFNAWVKETGLPLGHLSMTLAASIDEGAGPGQPPQH
ncbi:MAG TPA: DNA-3-methyladenine glycosylase I [Stellaceae bacterium]|nr:DNA-3-methyladenine glycosylase I [Stellaceae bacterium]